MILKTISEFWSFWKFPTNACSVPLHCFEGASPAPDNIPKKCSSMQQGELGQSPTLSSIHHPCTVCGTARGCVATHCTWLHSPWGKVGTVLRQEQLGFSHSVHLAGPHCCSCPFLVLLGCCSEGRAQEGGGHLPPLHGAQSGRKGQEEILLYQEQESKGAETLSKNGRESGVWTSALNSV